MTTATEYFIEIQPGLALEQKLQTVKDALIERLGPAVDDPVRTLFLRDSPHFTMQVARTDDFDAMVAAYRRAVAQLTRFNYTVEGVGRAIKGGLTEVHVVLDAASQRRFLEVHTALLDASVPYLAAQLPAMYREAAVIGAAAEHLRRYHFPFARELYRAHASVGRFDAATLAAVGDVLGGLDPRGIYTTGPLCIWKYVPGDLRFSTYNPVLVEWGGMR
jgi:hypothetical protein